MIVDTKEKKQEKTPQKHGKEDYAESRRFYEKWRITENDFLELGNH